MTATMPVEVAGYGTGMSRPERKVFVEWFSRACAHPPDIEDAVRWAKHEFDTGADSSDDDSSESDDSDGEEGGDRQKGKPPRRSNTTGKSNREPKYCWIANMVTSEGTKNRHWTYANSTEDWWIEVLVNKEWYYYFSRVALTEDKQKKEQNTAKGKKDKEEQRQQGGKKRKTGSEEEDGGSANGDPDSTSGDESSVVSDSSSSSEESDASKLEVAVVPNPKLSTMGDENQTRFVEWFVKQPVPPAVEEVVEWAARKFPGGSRKNIENGDRDTVWVANKAPQEETYQKNWMHVAEERDPNYYIELGVNYKWNYCVFRLSLSPDAIRKRKKRSVKAAAAAKRKGDPSPQQSKTAIPAVSKNGRGSGKSSSNSISGSTTSSKKAKREDPQPLEKKTKKQPQQPKSKPPTPPPQPSPPPPPSEEEEQGEEEDIEEEEEEDSEDDTPSPVQCLGLTGWITLDHPQFIS